MEGRNIYENKYINCNSILQLFIIIWSFYGKDRKNYLKIVKYFW